MQEHGPRGRIFTRQSVERDSNADTLPGLNLSGCLSARFARFHRAYLSAKISRAGGSAKRERPARTVSPPENTGSGRQIKRETRQRGNESPVDNPNRESKFNDPRARLSDALRGIPSATSLVSLRVVAIAIGYRLIFGSDGWN